MTETSARVARLISAKSRVSASSVCRAIWAEITPGNRVRRPVQGVSGAAASHRRTAFRDNFTPKTLQANATICPG